MTVVVVAAIALSPACTQRELFDREQAVRDVIAADNRVTRAEAECYVDRVLDEVGTTPLIPGKEIPFEQVPSLTRIRVDCFGVKNLGRPLLSSSTVPHNLDDGTTSDLNEPKKPGDDPDLDALYNACAAGDGSACDQLFDEAPPGSEYEEFAGTCGGRTKELVCADVYPSTTALS